MAWLASRSKLKQLKEEEEAEQQQNKPEDKRTPGVKEGGGMLFSTPHEEIIVYPDYEKIADQHEYLLKYNNGDQEYIGDQELISIINLAKLINTSLSLASFLIFTDFQR